MTTLNKKVQTTAEIQWRKELQDERSSQRSYYYPTYSRSPPI
jgi:hypothetical protein